MNKFPFENLDTIIDFQCLSDHSGILLTERGELFSYERSNIQKIDTPHEFSVADFHFLDKGHGVIIGEGGHLPKEFFIP